MSQKKCICHEPAQEEFGNHRFTLVKGQTYEYSEYLNLSSINYGHFLNVTIDNVTFKLTQEYFDNHLIDLEEYRQLQINKVVQL